MAEAARHIEYKGNMIYRRVLPAEDMVERKVCTVWPESIALPSPNNGLHVTIPGRPAQDAEPQDGAFYLPKNGGEPVPTNRYGFVHVGPAIERNDFGDNNGLSLLSISSRRNARDVIGLSDAGKDEVTQAVFCAAENTSPLFEKGYFVPVGVLPTEAELLDAEQRSQKFLRKALEKGDRIWNNTQKLDAIPPECITAARFLGKARSWAPAVEGGLEEPTATFECPCCGKPVEMQMKKCLVCNEALGIEEDGTRFWWNDPARKARIVAAKIAGKGKRPDQTEDVA
jgi:hypothetical protein